MELENTAAATTPATTASDPTESIDMGMEEPKQGAEESAKEEQQQAIAKTSPEETLQKYKVKYGDTEEEVDVERLKKSYALDKVHTQKSQELAKARKEFEAQKEAILAEKKQIQDLLTSLKEKPETLWDLADKLGHDHKKLAMQKAWEEYQWEQLPEHEKKRIIAERERDQYKQKLETLEEQERSEKEQFELQRTESEIEDQVIKVAELLGKPLAGKEGAVTVERIAQAMQSLYNANKNQKPTPEAVAQKVRQILDQDLKHFFSKLDPEKAAEFLPAEFLSSLKDQFIKKAEKNLPFSSSAKVGVANKQAANDSKAKKLGVNEFFNSLGK